MKISKLLECAEWRLRARTVHRKPLGGDCKENMKTGEEDNGRKL